MEKLMTDQTIKCTKCGVEIELTGALTEKINKELTLELQKDFDKKLEAERAEFEAKSAAALDEFESERKALEKERKGFEKKVVEKARKKAEAASKLELTDLRNQLEEKSNSVEELQKQELDLRKKTRELEDARKAFELDMERKLDEQHDELSEKIAKEIEEKHRLDDRAKDKQLADVMTQLEDAQRKAKQGSQQTQGEVAELEIEDRLKAQFPLDAIEPVSTGVRGADILQTVKNEKLNRCGSIIWEFKRTKNWSGDWISKLKDDQREAKAEIAVIVSEALPDGVEGIVEIEGVWVASFPMATTLALMLRGTLITVAAHRSAETGKSHKLELLYNYLYGSEFKQRVEAMVEAFKSMKDQLESEKRATKRQWAKRDKQIDRYVTAVSGMYGDMEGIGGLDLPAIEQLSLTAGEGE